MSDAEKLYKILVTGRTARPRSERLRRIGASGTGGGSTVVEIHGGTAEASGDGHTHANKADLDRLTADADGYLYADSLRETEDAETGATDWKTVTEKIKAGYADEAGHADKAHDLDEDSPFRTEADNMYLSRLHDDTAKGHIDFEQDIRVFGGVQFGESFADGLAGSGGRIDGSGNGELESLTLRRFLEVPELRYNRVSINVGNQWRAPGGGIILSVTPDYDTDGSMLPTGTVTLHLEDGEIGEVAADDICMGIYHDGFTAANNETATSDDGRGNFRFAGFCTCYFRITEITETARNMKFRYALRPVSDRWTGQFHPCEAMHFVCYGNFSDTARQVSRYSALTYERYLAGVNGWEFTEATVAAQFGDLSNLSLFGLDMTGYSAYLNNIYMTGRIHQFDAYPLRMEIDTGGDGFLAMGEEVTVTCTVWRGWDELTAQVTSWTVTRDSGDPADDAAWLLRDKAKDFAGTIVLRHDTDASADDLGSANTLSTLFTFRAELDDGTDTSGTLTI